VTGQRSPKERLLELVVFGPAGLAVTVVEEFPGLVEKGRHRLEGQVHTARLVGQVAFQMGRRQVEQTLGKLGERRGAAGSDTGAVSRPEPEPPARSAEAPVPPPGPGAPDHAPGHVPVNGSGPPPSLAIPGYDSLSASQVVQRLEGLSPGELEDVRAYEATHRHRRTILHRVEQLLTGADGAQP